MIERRYIACDLGAESGRVILGTLGGGRLELEEIHRFANGGARIFGTLRWDVLRIFEELKIGLCKVAARKIAVESLSVDSWGVDYALFNASQPLLALPYHYRDARTDETFAASLPKSELIFAETGIQFMQFNTVYQLVADVQQNAELLKIAEKFLNIADYLNFLFCGVACAEESMASTTQIYNPRTRTWSQKLIETFSIPAQIFPDVVPSGAKLGPLLPEVAAELDFADEVQVIATCSHDTGAAVAAVPAGDGDDWAYLSSGTWSLIGVELPEPLINDAAREHNFTNELGFGGSVRFLKNIIGLWILQECRRTWAQQNGELDYAELTHRAQAATPFRSLINPNAARFLKPGNMPEKIVSYCRETAQPVPEEPGAFGRCIVESLALLYRRTLDQLEKITGRTIRRLHVVGGGSKNSLLNQFTANAIEREVFAGPVEATAIGNVLIQAIALGQLRSLSELRRVVAESFPVQTFSPADAADWREASERFSKLNLLT